MAADRSAAQAEIADRVLELRGGEIGKLQRHGAERDEAVRMLLAPRGQRLVVHAHDLVGELALRVVPPVLIDAERLHVDAALVHRGNALRTERHHAGDFARERRALDEIRHLRDRAMRMEIDDLRALARDADFAPLSRPGARHGQRREQPRAGESA